MVNGYLANSLEEALRIKKEHDVIPYGGGTDLMAAGAQGEFLFLHKVPEMRQIVVDDEYVRIGASCTFTEVLSSDLVPQLMKEAVSRIAAPAIRNMGTMGGNLGNGSAKADSVLIEYVADALLVIANADGTRIVPVTEFYKGRKQLDLAKDELIVEILLPKTGLDNYYYKKVGARNALAISRVSFAGIVDFDGDVIKNLAVAFGAVEATVIRHKEIEAMLIGKTLAEAKELKGEFLAAFDAAICPIQGRVSKDYRKKVCMRLLSDFLEQKGL